MGEAAFHKGVCVVHPLWQDVACEEWDTNHRSVLEALARAYQKSEKFTSYPREHRPHAQDASCTMGVLAEGQELVDSDRGDAEVPVPVTDAWMYSGRSFECWLLVWGCRSCATAHADHGTNKACLQAALSFVFQFMNGAAQLLHQATCRSGYSYCTECHTEHAHTYTRANKKLV